MSQPSSLLHEPVGINSTGTQAKCMSTLPAHACARVGTFSEMESWRPSENSATNFQILPSKGCHCHSRCWTASEHQVRTNHLICFGRRDPGSIDSVILCKRGRSTLATACNHVCAHAQSAASNTYMHRVRGSDSCCVQHRYVALLR